MTDRVVLIPGGAGNIGRAVTRVFLEQGARVAIPFYKMDLTDSMSALQEEYGARLHVFALDLTTERGAGAAVREIIEWAGSLDAVVHMVGGYSGGMLLADTPLETWERMMDLNLKSAYLVAHAAIPVMLQGGGGSFVFVSSRAARTGRRNHAAYAVSKAALLTLTEALAEEYAEQGIRTNAVLPGTVDTDANRRAMPDADHESWTSPEEIARVIYFLASDESSAINGAAIPVYGRS